MSAGFTQNNHYRLGAFIVDPVAGILSADGATTQLQPKVMQLLQCLVENHGQIVTKQYLLENVWQDVFVVDGALRRCIHLLRKALDDNPSGQQYLETLPRRGYRLLLAPEVLAPQPESADSAERSYAGDAYRGLQVFDESHANIFFGRQAAIKQVLTAMATQVTQGHGFCLILGPSGSGKSSLARAGVLPALIRDSHSHKGTTLAPVIFQISEGPADPLGLFAARVIAATPMKDDAATAGAALAAQLADDEDEATSNILARLKGDDGRDPARLLILFDQFEELLSNHHLDDATRARFIATLYSLVRSGHVWLMATMRSEFYPQFMTHEALRYLRGKHGQIDLPFPGAAEIADIVRKPAALAGLSFDADIDNRRLDQIIIDDATRQANSLPLLQFALRELEMKCTDSTLKVADYRALGNLQGCLSGHADRVFAALPAAVQSALPEVLERMVIADPRNAGRVLKRTVRLSEFGGIPGATSLVEAFIEARLIITFFDKTNGAPSAQFAHEAVLANWARGRDWVQANYAEIRFRSWLDELATRWEDDGRPNHYLLSDGKPLLEATRLAARKPALSSRASAFVKASSRRASVKDVARGIVGVVLIALTIASLLLWRSALKSGEAAQTATRRAATTNEFLLSIFENANPGFTGGVDLTATQLLDRARTELAQTRVQTDAADRAALLSKLGETYLLIGQYDVADELFMQAEADVPHIEKDNPAVAAKVLLELGSIRHNQGHFDQSAAYLTRALELAELAGDNTVAATCKNSLGLLANSMGEYAAAKKHFADAQVALDKTQPPTATSIKLRPTLFSNQGAAHLHLRELDLAGAAFDRALALRRELKLADTADQTDLLSNIGTLRRFQGRDEEAIDYYRQAIALRSSLHGERHPRIAHYLANQSSVELKLERFADARESARRGLNVVATGSGHNDAVVALLHGNYTLASWLAAAPLAAGLLDATKSQIPVMELAYGNEHKFVYRVRAAVVALEIDAHAATIAGQPAESCGVLAQLGEHIRQTEARAVHERLAGYFHAGAICNAR